RSGVTCGLHATTSIPNAAPICAMRWPIWPQADEAQGSALTPTLLCAAAQGPLAQLNLRDRVAVNFVGAVDDANGALVGIGFGEPEVLADAGRAVGLDRPVDDLATDVRRNDLDHRDLGPRVFVADGVHLVRRVEREQARL